MKRTIKFFIFVLAWVPILAAAQVKSNIDLAVGRFQQFYNKQENDSIFTMLSPRSQSIMDLDKTKGAMGKLYSQAGELKSYTFLKQEGVFSFYKAIFKNTVLQLIASLNDENKLDAFRFIPFKEEAKAADKDSYTLTTPTGKIVGSLSMPEGKGKVPVVLLIAGSGPTDMDGNSTMGVNANTYKMLADSLKQAGIACLRYDKRGIGQSAPALKDEADVTFDAYVNDAVGFIKMLKNDGRFSTVVVAGHSEGSLIGMLAAQKEKATKYISIAGAGERIDKILLEQLAKQPGYDLVTVKKILDSLASGKEVEVVPETLSGLFHKSIQPFMRSWLKYDPVNEIKKLTIPVLILQGKNDIQVSAKDAELLKKAALKARLVIIPKMNHVLKDAPLERNQNMATYSNPGLPISPGLIPAILNFIKS